MKYKCIKACFINDKLYKPGMSFDLAVGQKLPCGKDGKPYFVSAAKAGEIKKEYAEPKTYAEMQQEEAKAVLESVGHGKAKKKSKK